MRPNKKIPAPRQGRVAAVYCRKSNLRSGETKGRSTAQQLEQCLMAAKALGYDVPERLVFIEPDGQEGYWFWKDAEGRHQGPYRPELTRLMEEVDAGNVDAVIVWRTDRAYRDEIVAAYFLRALRDRGVRLYARTQDLAIHTASGYESAATQACSNKAYRDKISEDVTRDHEMLASVGELPRDCSCLGFVSAGKGSKRVIAQPEHIATVRRIFNWYVFGEPGEAPLSGVQIAVRCMELGLRTSVGARGHKCKYPDRVEPGAITRILRNPQYMGKILHDGKLYSTTHFHVPAEDGSGRLEPVVPEEVFLAAKERLEHGNKRERDKRAGLLNCLVVCPCCGRTCLIRTRDGRKRIWCQNKVGAHRKGMCVGDDARSIFADELERWVLKHLAPLVAAEIQAIRALQRGDAGRAELAVAERRLAEALDTEGQELAALVGTMDARQFAAVAAHLRKGREALESRVAELRIRLRRESVERSDPLDLLSENPKLVRQALLQAVRYISVTRRGVIVLTATGEYIGARFGVGERGGRRGGRLPLRILPPSVEATRECRGWISDPTKFIEGLRRMGGRWARPLPDDEILPEYRECALDEEAA